MNPGAMTSPRGAGPVGVADGVGDAGGHPPLPSLPLSGGPERRARAVLVRAVRESRSAMIPATVLLCLYQIAEAGVPILLGVIVDRLMGSPSWWAPVVAVAALAAVIGTVSYSWRTAYLLLQRANAVQVHRQRSALSGTIVAPRPAATGVPPGELVTVAGEDVGQASDIVEIIPVALSAAVGVVVSAGVLAAIDPLLGAGVLGGTVLLLGSLHLISVRVTRSGERQQRLLAEATARVADLLRGLRPLGGIGGRYPAMAGYRVLSGRARRQSEHLARLSGGYEGVSTGASTLLVGLVGVAAAARALAGEISIGELVIVVGLAQFVAEPLRQLSKIPRYVALAKASAQRIARVEAARSPSGGVRVPAASDDGTTPPALSVRGAGGDFRATEGVMTAVDCDPEYAVAVASSLGAGPDAGADGPEITVRGVDIRRMDVGSLRAVVLADARHPAIFPGTVGSNIAPGGHFHRGVDDAVDPVDAARRAQLADLVPGRWEEVLDRPVADRGSDLSGGQRQRVSLARALHADPEILVLVDPDSAVDAVTGAALAEAVSVHRRGRTTIVLSAGAAFSRVADERHHCVER